ncbi:hypothetical protein JSQ81_05990 [Sporosarcina sp. Marseille-Q4063]|uniref:hypothetical protein n=1 Tax=Sporosarcina sp. Marseille-Q4063 TaxID=2810514 RepID=UPI001BAFFDA5|nr:hypothetical protein [Sporosarcina sp. Marseille-Q4063]QUW23116.1 hypothetical protein JSQ81_05990 [Sporosarcina sp. Marseille-Q4063]
MKETFEEIDRLSQNPETRHLADFREQELKDILQREADAIEQEKRKTVISLYHYGMSIVDIAKNVRISPEKAMNIIKSIEE